MTPTLRGETALVAKDGTEYPIIFTIEALMMIEAKLNVGPLELIQKAVDQRMTATELVMTVAAGLEAHRREYARGTRPVNPAKVPQIIEQCGGFLRVMIVVADALARSQALGLQTDDAEEGEDGEPDPTGTGDEPSISLSTLG